MFKDRIEVSLDGRQIFYLFFGGAVVATLVFVLGVMVGRQVESRTVADTGASATLDPLAALDQLESDNKLSFPAALRGDEVSLGDVDDSLAKRTLVRAEAKTVIVAPAVKPSKPEPETKEMTKAESAKAKVEAAKAKIEAAKALKAEAQAKAERAAAQAAEA
ncbi:MAG: hypothetical protein JKY56_13055, partial [Kofleriaceae bacterium]|nr:hypothetical protein [Kofleriaceae bacterium]